MVNSKIANTIKKNLRRTNSNGYAIKKKWVEANVATSFLASNVIAGKNKKMAKITELPINGYLTIDDEPLVLNQIILLTDVSRMKFNIQDNIQSSNYGNFKFFVFHGNVTEEEYYFKIDANIINNSNYTNDNHETISLKSSNEDRNDIDDNTASGYKLKNEKLERELLDFIAKRESGVVYDTKADSWVEATKSIFEEDTFENNDVDSKVL